MASWSQRRLGLPDAKASARSVPRHAADRAAAWTAVVGTPPWTALSRPRWLVVALLFLVLLLGVARPTVASADGAQAPRPSAEPVAPTTLLPPVPEPQPAAARTTALAPLGLAELTQPSLRSGGSRHRAVGALGPGVEPVAPEQPSADRLGTAAPAPSGVAATAPDVDARKGETAAAGAATPPASTAERHPAPPVARRPESGTSGAGAAQALHPADVAHPAERKLELPRVPESFNTYEGGWVRFAYPPSVRQRVQPLIAEADAVRERLAAQLGQQVLRETHVFVARTPGEMASFAPEGAPFPKYASGVAYPTLGLVLLTISPVHPGQPHDLAEVFRHELSHVALHDAVLGADVPRWFNEGYAVNASGESRFARLEAVWTATVAGTLIPLARLDRSFPEDSASVSLAYAESAEIVRFLSRQQEAERFAATVARVRGGEAFASAIESAYGLDLGSLEQEWRQDAAKRYTFWPVFFGGSLVWMAALGLFVWGWRKRRRTAKATLARWAIEEAAEDALRARARAAGAESRIHIVFPRGPEAADAAQNLGPPPPRREAIVPMVEHDGTWHTLH